MAVIKVTDIAYVRLALARPRHPVGVPGELRAGAERKTDNAIYYRATDPVHHVHITEKGDPKFVGIAYHAASEDDLKTLAKAPGASGIENMDEPGGGKRVRLDRAERLPDRGGVGHGEGPADRQRRGRCSTPATRRSPAPAS